MTDPLPKVRADIPGRDYKCYDFAMAAYVTVLICSNLIGAAKRAQIGGFQFGAGILFFPLGYLLGDILTEVYGYARARRVVWAGFGAALFMALMAWVVVAMPPAHDWGDQAVYVTAFGQTPRIVAASVAAFWAGEISNAFVLAKMKLLTNGRFLWTRTIGSTVVGQGVDSLVFYPLAFWGVWQVHNVIVVMITNYVLKVLWEVVLTPVTYAVVNWMKRVEGVDVYDVGTDFTPFSLRKY